MLDFWEGEARADGITEEVIQAVVQRLRSYDGLSPDSRADALTGLWKRSGLFGDIDGDGRAAIERAMAAVGLSGFEQRTIATLSGGQMQRMLFARLLLQDASVIVLDEPFNAVDAKTSADLFDLVRRWHAEQRTVLAALHDLDVVKANFPETLLLAREPVAWGTTAAVLTPDNWVKARRMCEAFDEQAEACGRGR
jgi:zinc/manganese transport system ATP-binding protein